MENIWSCFFVPLLSNSQPETAFTTPALFSYTFCGAAKRFNHRAHGDHGENLLKKLGALSDLSGKGFSKSHSFSAPYAQ